MKAEHRKELHTNVLAHHLNTWYKAVKAKSSPSSITFWVFGALILVLIGALYYYFTNKAKTASALWTRLDVATSSGNVRALQEIADGNASRGTVQARTARFQIARLKLQRGLNSLGSEKPDPEDSGEGKSPRTQREVAIANIEEARNLYNELAPEASGFPLLIQEALMGSAKAEESLIGIPKADGSGESRGTLERAKELYEKLVKDYPDSFQGKAAAKRLAELDNPETLKFYDTLGQSFTKLGS